MQSILLKRRENAKAQTEKELVGTPENAVVIQILLCKAYIFRKDRTTKWKKSGWISRLRSRRRSCLRQSSKRGKQNATNSKEEKRESRFSS